MRVDCPDCNQSAVVTSSNKISSQVKELYCQCMNSKNCGGSFVTTLAFKHYLNPPMKTTQEMAAAMLRSLSKSERNALLQPDLFN